VESGEDHWYCGYVGVKKESPLYGIAYDDRIPMALPRSTKIGKRGLVSMFCYAIGGNFESTPLDVYFDVHGSLTFSSCEENLGKYPVDENELWWFGFECDHHADNPYVQDADYTRNECESLAAQIVELEPKLKAKIEEMERDYDAWRKADEEAKKREVNNE